MSGYNHQVDLQQQVTLTLPLGAWNTVLNLMAKGPWDVVDPLMQVMRQQLAAPPRPRVMEPSAFSRSDVG